MNSHAPAEILRELRYESHKTGASGGEVRQAVKSVGNARKKVEAELKK